MHLDYHAIYIEGTRFHASLGRTGVKKRASFENFVHQICTTVRKWELCRQLLIKPVILDVKSKK